LDSRLSVQYVIRPQTEKLHDYRGYAGKIISGIYRKGDHVVVLPSGYESKIKSVEVGGVEVNEAFAQQSVVLQLEDDLDAGRGDMIAKNDSQPQIGQELELLVCWMDSKPLLAGNKYLFQINSRLVKGVVNKIEYKLDVNTLNKQFGPARAELNDIIKVTIKVSGPIPYDPYKSIRSAGAGILIDETSNVTVGACMIQ
jgi:sulfate adenylyltransferase subunit 1